MKSREAIIESPLFTEDEIQKMKPIAPGGQLRLGHPRQRRRVPDDGGPQPAPRDDDAHPRGVGEGPGDPGRAQGLLRVPRRDHRALGRPRLGRLHRRDADRGHPRPQRAAALALLPDRRQHPHHGLGGGRPRRAARRRSWPRAASSRGACSSPRSRRDGSSPTRRSRPASAGSSPTPQWLDEGKIPLAELAPPAPAPPAPGPPRPHPAEDLRLHPRGPAHPHGPDGDRTARSRSARWATTPPSPCCPRSRGTSSTTSTSSSPRSPTRPSTPSARRW